jgi:hypothetical protein
MNLTSYVTWIKAHERLLLLAGVLVFGAFGVNKAYDYLIKHDQVQAQIANQQATIAAQKVQNDSTANQQINLQLAQLQNSYDKLSAQLAQSMQQRATSTQTQKQTDDKSDAAALASRIHQLLGVGTITVETQAAPIGSTLSYSLDAAHADADSLEDLQQAKGDVKDLNTKLVACSQLTDKQTDLITGLKNQVGDGILALIAEQHAHADDVKTLKLEKKKSWLNGFKWGAIAGFVGGLFVPKV